MSPGPMVTVGGREGGRVHKLTLVKPAQAGYGFSIRGGVEHQLGIFVSEVEVGSEAHTQVLVVLVVVVKYLCVFVGSAARRPAAEDQWAPSEGGHT